MDQKSLSRRDFLRLAGLGAVGATLAGCAQPTPEKIVVTQIVEGEVKEVEVTRQVEVTREVKVTAEAPLRTIRVITTDAPDLMNDKPEDYQWWLDLVEGFKQVRPDVELIPHPGGYLPDVYWARLAAGTLEDTFGIWFTDPPKFIKAGAAADVTELFRSKDLGRDLNPSALVPFSDEQGHFYGVPIGIYVLCITYSRKLFKQAGLDPDAPPKNWADFRTAAAAVTSSTEAKGFAHPSINNQGGWHFTCWTYTGGGDMERQDANGKWQATFDEEPGRKWIQQLYDMRWKDQSIPEEVLIDAGKVEEWIATEQIAMGVTGSDTIAGLVNNLGVNPEDFGVAAMPQNGGNATLFGGYGFLFNAKSPPEVIDAAVDYVIYRFYDLGRYEADLKRKQQKGEAIGAPEPPLFVGQTQEKRYAILSKYANLPLENFKPFIEDSAKIAMKAEPPFMAQELYAAVDVPVQAVLTDQGADPLKALAEAQKTFQEQLDKAQA